MEKRHPAEFADQLKSGKAGRKGTVDKKGKEEVRDEEKEELNLFSC